MLAPTICGFCGHVIQTREMFRAFPQGITGLAQKRQTPFKIRIALRQPPGGRAMLAPTGTHDLKLCDQPAELFVEFSYVITVGETVIELH